MEKIIGGSLLTEAIASVAVVVSSSIFLSVLLATDSQAAVNVLNSKVRSLEASPESTANAIAVLTGSNRSFDLSPSSSLNALLNLTVESNTDGLSLCNVVREILNLWGIEGVCNAPDFAIERAIGDVNSAMQTVWNQSSVNNYWSNQTLSIVLADGETSQVLPNNIQNVIGPCRREDNRRPLATLNTIGELETFSDLYLDNLSCNEPLAYHVERLNQIGSDPAKTIFNVTPAVQGSSLTFLLRVVLEAPRYTTGDLNTCPVIPIPHRYVESLLLPIARYRASSFWLFASPDSKGAIDQEYQQAMASIGMADPLPESPKGEVKK